MTELGPLHDRDRNALGVTSDVRDSDIPREAKRNHASPRRGDTFHDADRSRHELLSSLIVTGTGNNWGAWVIYLEGLRWPAVRHLARYMLWVMGMGPRTGIGSVYSASGLAGRMPLRGDAAHTLHGSMYMTSLHAATLERFESGATLPDWSLPRREAQLEPNYALLALLAVSALAWAAVFALSPWLFSVLVLASLVTWLASARLA